MTIATITPGKYRTRAGDTVEVKSVRNGLAHNVLGVGQWYSGTFNWCMVPGRCHSGYEMPGDLVERLADEPKPRPAPATKPAGYSHVRWAQVLSEEISDEAARKGIPPGAAEALLTMLEGRGIKDRTLKLAALGDREAMAELELRDAGEVSDFAEPAGWQLLVSPKLCTIAGERLRNALQDLGCMDVRADDGVTGVNTKFEGVCFDPAEALEIIAKVTKRATAARTYTFKATKAKPIDYARIVAEAPAGWARIVMFTAIAQWLTPDGMLHQAGRFCVPLAGHVNQRLPRYVGPVKVEVRFDI
jgi:hypothetical protein